MANRSPRDKLKRVLSENVPRNIDACMQAIIPFLLIYSESDESAQQVAIALDSVLEALEALKEHCIELENLI